MRLLFVIRTIHRDYGGPLEGAREVMSELVRQGHTCELAHMDPPGSEGESYFDVPLHAFGPSSLAYGYTPRLAPWMAEHAADYDAVIVNGLWHFPGVGIERGLRNTNTPYFVYAHGSLNPWFQRASLWKELQRRVYWKFFEARVLLGARAVLFTSQEELELARDSYRPFPTALRVVPYCSAEPPRNVLQLAPRFLAKFPHFRDRKLILFLGRIHPVKGCDILIQAFARVAGRDPRLHLVIAGPDRMNLIPGLRTLAASLGIADRITWTGGLYEEDKWGALAAADLFISSSHAECFGVSMVAALGAGTPVAVSNKVNTWREIYADGAGFIGDATIEGATDLFTQWLKCSDESLMQMRERARKCFHERYSPPRMAESLLRMLQECGVPHSTVAANVSQ